MEIASKILQCKVSLVLSGLGVSYLMLCNALYGIAGYRALVGNGLIWGGLLLHCSIRMPNGDTLRISNTSTCDVCAVASKSTQPLPTFTPSFSPPPDFGQKILQIYVCTVYFMAGLAKTGSDWLNGNTVSISIHLTLF